MSLKYIATHDPATSGAADFSAIFKFAQKQWGISETTFAACCEPLTDDPSQGLWQLRDFLGFPRKSDTSVVSAIGLRSEDGEVFQARLTSGSARLLAPEGAGRRVYRPKLSPELRQGIERRWEQSVIESPLFITEGPGKSLSVLERGGYAINGYGVDGLIEKYENLAAADELEGELDNGHIITKSGQPYRKKRGRKLQRPQLPKALAALATPKREVYLVPDMDSDPEQRYKLGYSWHKLACLLKQRDCIVRVLTWAPEQGKGIDDYFQRGGTLDELLSKAMGAYEFKLKCELERLLCEPSQVVNTREMKDAVDFDAIPETGILVTNGGTGTGKTNLEAELSKAKRFLSVTVLRSLMFEQADRLNATARNNGIKSSKDGSYFESKGVFADRLTTCFAALSAISLAAQYPEGLEELFLDETSTGLRELATSDTLKRNRIQATGVFMDAVATAKRVTLMDADLSRTELDIIRSLKPDAPVHYIQNLYKPDPWPVTWLADQGNAKGAISHFAGNLEQWLGQHPGQFVHWAADSKTIAKNVQELLLDSGIGSHCVTSETPADCEINKALQAQDWDKLRDEGIQVIITSPSIVTGVSWSQPDLFSLVIGTFSGCSITPKQMRQALHRVRPSVPRWVWCAFHRAKGGSTETHSRAIHRRYERVLGMAKKGLDLDLDISDAHKFSAEMAARLTADDNRWCSRPADALKVVLQHDGHILTPVEIGKIEGDDYTNASKRRSQRERIEVKNSAVIDEEKAESLATAAQSGALTKDERLSYQRYKICEFNAIEPEALTVEHIEIDEKFGYRSQVRNFEELFGDDGEELATARTAITLHKAVQDVRRNSVARRGRIKLQLPMLIEYLQEGEFTQDDETLVAFANECQHYANAIKDTMNVTLTPKMGAIQVISAMLGQLGLKLKSERRMVAGQRQRYYSLDRASLALMREVTQRRHAAGTERQALEAYQERLEEQSKARGYRDEIAAARAAKERQAEDDYWIAEALKGCLDRPTLEVCMGNTPTDAIMRAWDLLPINEQSRISHLWHGQAS